MRGLPAEVVTALLSGAKKKPSTGNGLQYALVRNMEGQLERVSLKNLDVGHFEGRAGSIRRSRKGATRRLANGRRYYVQGDCIILAYLNKP